MKSVDTGRVFSMPVTKGRLVCRRAVLFQPVCKPLFDEGLARDAMTARHKVEPGDHPIWKIHIHPFFTWPGRVARLASK
jgi:hypothetical protein